MMPPPAKAQPRAPRGFSSPALKLTAGVGVRSPSSKPTHREEAQDLGSPPGHLVYVAQNLQQI